MLNKELLLNLTKKKVEHVKLTVGKYKDSISKGLVYGYNDPNYGSLDKIPYWEDFSVDGLFYLETFADFMLNKQAEVSLASDNVEDISYNSFLLNIKIVETGNIIPCYFDRRPGTYVHTNGLFGFSQMVGQTVTLEFDPPPDGYMYM